MKEHRRDRMNYGNIGRFLAGLLLSVALFSLIGSPALSKQAPAKDAAPKPEQAGPGANFEKLTVEELIDRLQEVAEGGEQMGLDQPVNHEFLAWNLDSFYSQRYQHGRPFPKNSPVMRELVSRGLQSLPKLLEHLDDKRSTKLVAEALIFLVRDRKEGLGFLVDAITCQETATDFVIHTDAHPSPTGFEKLHPHSWRYPVKVGDLCYIAIGQIVNRNYRVIRKHEPTVLLNSPVYTPEIAKACRKQWTGLTAEKHKALLISDCLDHEPGADPTAAMIRLSFYYPKDGERIICEHIRRPFSEKDAAWEFCYKNLLSITKEEDARMGLMFNIATCVYEIIEAVLYRFWMEKAIDEDTAIQSYRILHSARQLFHQLLFRRFVSILRNQELSVLMDRFERTHGKQEAKEIPITLMKCVVEYEKQAKPSLDLAVGAFKAKSLLADRFPDRETYRYQFINRTTIFGADRFLRDLPDYRSAKIDQAIYEVFQRVSSSQNTGQNPGPWLARICIDKLAGKNHDPELRIYLEKQIEWTRKNSNSPSAAWVLQRDLEALAKLKK